MGLFWALVFAAANAASGIIVKASGQQLTDLLVSQFGTAAILFIVWNAFVPKSDEENSAVRSPAQWGFMFARTVIGLAATFEAYRAYQQCLGLGPALVSMNAIYLPLLGLFIRSMLRGWRPGYVLVSSGMCTAGVVIAVSGRAPTDVCSQGGLTAGAVAGLLLAALGLAQARLRMAPTFIGAAYCSTAFLLVAGMQLANGATVSVSPIGVVLGLVYAMVQFSSQLANRWNPAITSILGLSQIGISVFAAVVIFHESQPSSTWAAIVVITAGMLVLRAGKERPQPQ